MPASLWVARINTLYLYEYVTEMAGDAAMERTGARSAMAALRPEVCSAAEDRVVLTKHHRERT
jgi:hypothetical protein